MNKSKTIQIVKRDGSVEPFDSCKLRRCIAAAMQECGHDSRYADALVSAVELHLLEWTNVRRPSSEYIFRCVRTVLDETEMGEVARQLTQHRRDRGVRRRRLRVIDMRRPDRKPYNWDKTRVAGTLQRRHQLRRGSARILAAEIERRLLALDYGVVSTALVAELIRNELMAWGLSEEAITVAGARRGAPRTVTDASSETSGSRARRK